MALLVLLLIVLFAVSPVSAGADPIREIPLPGYLSSPTALAPASGDSVWIAAKDSIARVDAAGAIEAHELTSPGAFPIGASPSAVAGTEDGGALFASGSIGFLAANGEVSAFKVADTRSVVALAGSSPTEVWFVARSYAAVTGGFVEGPSTVGELETSGTVQEYPLPGADPKATAIVEAPDGGHWVAYFEGEGAAEASGVAYVSPSGGSEPLRVAHLARSPIVGLAAGPDGDLWIAQEGQILRVAADGQERLLRLGAHRAPAGIAVDPDDQAWATVLTGTKSPYRGLLDRVTASGYLTEFPAPEGLPQEVTVDGAGTVWFVEQTAGKVALVRSGTPGIEVVGIHRGRRGVLRVVLACSGVERLCAGRIKVRTAAHSTDPWLGGRSYRLPTGARHTFPLRFGPGATRELGRRTIRVSVTVRGGQGATMDHPAP